MTNNKEPLVILHHGGVFFADSHLSPDLRELAARLHPKHGDRAVAIVNAADGRVLLHPGQSPHELPAELLPPRTVALSDAFAARHRPVRRRSPIKRSQPRTRMSKREAMLARVRAMSGR